MEPWGCLGGVLAGWAVIACAPFVRGGVERTGTDLVEAFFAVAVGLFAIWWLTQRFGLHDLDDSRQARGVALALTALLNLGAVVGFADRFRRRGEDLDRWLALGATLTLFASIDLLFEPVAAVRYVTQGDFLRLFAYVVLVIGVCRAILRLGARPRGGRGTRPGRARDPRRALPVSVRDLDARGDDRGGRDVKETMPKLRDAVQAAQTEARFAVLALSSAAGRAPFDAALRRYVDFLTADGVLEVELEIDGEVGLAPDEQIEVFRIVQEGLANVRRHAHARRAWVVIALRGTDRLVTIRDDGTGFVPGTDAAAQGLANMRQRAAAIGGAFTLKSSPGRGTAVELVLRP